MTLRSGAVVCSWCESWRIECEARSVGRRADPHAALDLIEQKRGRDARLRLEAEIVLQMPTKDARRAYLAGLRQAGLHVHAEAVEAAVRAAYAIGKTP